MNHKLRPFFSMLVIPLVLVILLVQFSTAIVSAQDLNPTEAEPPKTVDYQLSYPGLLPDHPLYFLKTGRDRIMSFFISKPMERAEFNLLQADKRVEASLMLFKEKESKIDLAQSTFSKGANYFDESINNTSAAKSQGINISDFSNKLADSNKKHKQILQDMISAQNGRYKKKFAAEHDRLNDFEKRVKELNPKR